MCTSHFEHLRGISHLYYLSAKLHSERSKKIVNKMLKENALLSYNKSSDEVKYVTHKFLFGLRNKKVKVLSYGNEPEEVLLYMLRESNSLLEQYQILEDPLRVEIAYEFFADTVKGDALDNWLEILQDGQIYQLGVQDAMSWTSQIQAFKGILLDAEACDDKREYL